MDYQLMFRRARKSCSFCIRAGYLACKSGHHIALTELEGQRVYGSLFEALENCKSSNTSVVPLEARAAEYVPLEDPFGDRLEACSRHSFTQLARISAYTLAGEHLCFELTPKLITNKVEPLIISNDAIRVCWVPRGCMQ